MGRYLNKVSQAFFLIFKTLILMLLEAKIHVRKQQSVTYYLNGPLHVFMISMGVMHRQQI